MEYYWKIEDGRIWSSTDNGFVTDVPEGETVTPLYDSGRPAGIEYLRECLRFYGCGFGELAGPEERAEAIRAELEAIDSLSIRPLRAALAGAATEADEAKLAELETRAAELRAELAAL